MLSLVLPTFNESQNLPELVPAVIKQLQGIPHEIIIVDDNSPDQTWKVAQDLAKHHSSLRVIRRVGRRGLSSAVIEGFLASTGDVLAVMDADGQHDMGLLNKLYEAVRAGSDMAIGSRYMEGGSVGQWDERRQALSRFATKLATKLCKVTVRDPMSGFFAVSRTTFEAALPTLNPKGFKILLDILVHVPAGTTAVELPFTFGERKHGESKLSRRVQIEFLEYLYDAVLGNYIPLTFVKYCIVGAAGVVVNLATYALFAFIFTGISNATSTPLHPLMFFVTLTIGIEAAILFNFFLNNLWTFSQVRLRGFALIKGFIFYHIVCALGALANFAVVVLLLQMGIGPLSLLLGAVIGAVWNYTVSLLFTWKA